jgi:hypothetical protein
MLNVVCYWWRNWCGYWGPKYIEKLQNMLARNTTVDYKFHVFTDNMVMRGYYFNPFMKWNLNKFQCFDKKYGLEGRILTIDLDVLILDNIDDILKFDDEFITCEAAYQKGQAGGSIVGTTVQKGRDLWNFILQNKDTVEQETGGSERFFIRKYVPECTFWQDKYSGIYSYKKDCKDGVPSDARIIRMHGKPRPHEIRETSELVKKYWI